MATTVSHYLGTKMKSLVGVSGPPLGRSRDFHKCSNGSMNVTSDSVRAARVLFGNSCSSSGGLSQSRSTGTAVSVERLNSKKSVWVGSARPSGGYEFTPGQASFSSFLDGVQSLDTDKSSAGRNKRSSIRSVSDNRTTAASEDSLFGSLESSDVARPQPIAQGFGDSPFVGEFAIDLTGGAASASGSNEFESMTVSVPLYQPKWIWFATSPEQENLIIDRVINATILGSAGIIALTKMLTVDHDYWHGWTAVEILEYAPVHNWFAYEEQLRTHPVLAKMMISGTVYSLGDWIAQCVEGKPALDFNRTRMLRSGLVGFCLHGSMSHFYYQFCEWLFPSQDWWVVPLKVLFDQTVWAVVWNSIYFLTIGLLRLDSPSNIYKELRETFFPLLIAGWKLWPFAHVITYGVVPLEQRLLWVDIVEIVWVTILATYSNEKSEARIAEAETVEELKETTIERAVGVVSVDSVAEEK